MARRRSLRRQLAQGTSVAPASKPVVKTAPPTLQTTLIFVGLALYLGTTLFRLGVQEWHLFKQAQVLELQRSIVVAHHQSLEKEIAMSRTNAGIEKLAREQLGLVMAEEIPVKTVAAVAPTPAPVLAALPSAQHQGTLPPAMAALVKFFEPLWN